MRHCNESRPVAGGQTAIGRPQGRLGLQGLRYLRRGLAAERHADLAASSWRWRRDRRACSILQPVHQIDHVLEVPDIARRALGVGQPLSMATAVSNTAMPRSIRPPPGCWPATGRRCRGNAPRRASPAAPSRPRRRSWLCTPPGVANSADRVAERDIVAGPCEEQPLMETSATWRAQPFRHKGQAIHGGDAAS